MVHVVSFDAVTMNLQAINNIKEDVCMQAFAHTDKGILRVNNQDYVYSLPCKTGALPNLFIVADGMGGHLGGDYASEYAVTRIVELIKNIESLSDNIIEIVDGVIQQVNKELYEKACDDEALFGMGTTLVLCFIKDGVVYAANVGDSRLYIINDSKIRQITHDHSLVDELVANGSIEKNSSTYFQKKNVITRAVGTEPSVCVDYFETEIDEADILLLCSDGLSNMVSDEMIKEIVNERKDDLEQCAASLVHMANYNGGTDNISVIVVKE